MPNASHHTWLKELTALPTAAGCEDRVIAWIEDWAKRRRSVQLRRDRFGNLMLARKGSRSRKPIIFTAHMDHPAFVVTAVKKAGRELRADFRGGVADEYFTGTRVAWTDGRRRWVGSITRLRPSKDKQKDKAVTIAFERAVPAQVGDVITWDVGRSRIVGDRLKAPACDDLAGVAAALAAFDELLRKRVAGLDVRVLLTRAEEVGFVGAIAACGSGIMPEGARLIALENSRSFAESPIGRGPIVRVGDRTSTFNPELTYRICQIAEALAERHDDFAWQRKLMPGGTCEATAYHEFGYQATCLCLPLGNYHNMNDGSDGKGKRIDAETISLSDFDGLIRLLIETARQLDDTNKVPTLRAKLNEILERRRGLVEGG